MRYSLLGGLFEWDVLSNTLGRMPAGVMERKEYFLLPSIHSINLCG
jgi:hypothetical protein